MGGEWDPSIAHLLGRIDVVRLRVAAVVAARRAVDGSADDPFLGLYLSDERIDSLLRDERVWVAEDVAEERRREVERAADETELAGGRLRLRELAEEFGLERLDIELLLTAIAPDVDDRFERYYGYLNDDVTRRRASIGLALGLAGVVAAGGTGRDRFDESGPLRSGGLIEVDEPDRPYLTRSVRVPDRVTAHLLGSDRPDPAVAFALLDVAPTDEPPDERLTRAISRPDAFVYLHDRTASAVEQVVDAALVAGREAVVIDLERVAASEAEAVATAAVREARLRGAVLVAGPIDAMADADVGFLHHLSSCPVPLVLTGHRGWDPRWARRPPLITQAPRLSGKARARIWASALVEHELDSFETAAITAQYRLGADQIRRAALAATASARAWDRPLDATDVRLGARQQNAASLERLAVRVDPGVSWDDLVVPDVVRDGLRNLVARTRHREQVLSDWRMRPGGGRGTGITALFAGDPGTGKTMSAEVVASELGLDLYVVNLATVVDKYIGETEKNLDRIFAESDDVNGVLLFDEADALFGQRSEVRDSHDRYANIEVAYLLQRMETFDGLAILATNLRSNIDEAFTRRLDIVVDFPMPNRELRRGLWAVCLSPLAVADDVDLDFCADAFELSGGDIRSIAVTVAYRAASEGHAVAMADVIAAVGQEYRKLGRLCLEAEFGRYYPMLAPSASFGT